MSYEAETQNIRRRPGGMIKKGQAHTTNRLRAKPKGCTEALIMAAQKQAVGTRAKKPRFTTPDPTCSLGREAGETVHNTLV